MRFYINVDHVATVREARKTDEPDPVRAALDCEEAGIDGVTVHLREDRRHIQDDDVRRMADVLKCPLNLELATADDIVQFAKELAPHQVTFVPEKRQEITTEGGLNLSNDGKGPEPKLLAAVEKLLERGVRTSLFIDPDPVSVELAKSTGADAVEFHTGEYANRYPDSDEPLARLKAAVKIAKELGLAVHAGHGLTYENVRPVARIPEIEELSIGHSIVSRSIFVGIRQAVLEMDQILKESRVD
ncbi:MAG: pyridoxine 5'-phosphate synthase [Gemmatimonadota bacterium]|nr:pyridoxine 5'-phosphate synthase [Gemmatimonadota bacterium]MDH5803941.1 pyridoxine 5'-phosphate synthase [Gemmatimonadota bacterium]